MQSAILKMFFWTLAIFLFALMIAGCPERMVGVQSGERVICSQCGGVVGENIETRQVPESKAGEYSVKQTTSICNDCKKKDVVGTWDYKTGFGDLIVKLYEGGQGEFDGESFQWQSTGFGSFEANISHDAHWNNDGPKKFKFSGEVIDGGQKLLIHGYQWFSRYGFGGGQTVFERIE